MLVCRRLRSEKQIVQLERESMVLTAAEALNARAKWNLLRHAIPRKIGRQRFGK
jgi:hypothetical protein